MSRWQRSTRLAEWRTINRALQEALNALHREIENLSNRNVINLVENYFTEMALIVVELGRLVSPGGQVFMVNDNVRYHGEEIPVDLILSDFAEQCGFRCESIRDAEPGQRELQSADGPVRTARTEKVRLSLEEVGWLTAKFVLRNLDKGHW